MRHNYTYLALCAFILFSAFPSVKLQAQLTVRLDSMINMNYDTAKMTYYLDGRTVMMYDNDNNNTYWVNYERDTSLSVWLPEDSAGYTYNASGQLTQEIAGEWDNGSSSFELEDRTDFYYNTDGTLSSLYNFNYNSGNWDSSYYLLNTYDANMMLIEEEAYYWDNGSMQWEGDERTTFTYNANNQLDEELEFRWDGVSSNWNTQANNKEEYIYNSGTNFLDTTYYFSWNSGSMMFESTYRTIYENDAQGNFVKKQDQNYNMVSGWVTTSQSLQAFNVSVPLEQIALPINYVVDFEENQVSQMDSSTFYDYDYSENRLYLQETSIFHYSPLSGTGINEEGKTVDFQIYPNPASERVQVILNDRSAQHVELMIFDSNGRMVINRRMNQQTTLSLEGLSKGMYLIRLRGGHIDSSRKLLIK